MKHNGILSTNEKLYYPNNIDIRKHKSNKTKHKNRI